MTLEEKREDIAEVLRQVCEIRKHQMVESEIRAFASRLIDLHGLELFRELRSIPGQHSFPSVFQVEHRVRQAMGLLPAKGLSREKIEKNEREIVVSGGNQTAAQRGAKFLENVFSGGPPPPLPEKRGSPKGQLIDELAMDLHFGTTAGLITVEPSGEIKVDMIDPLEMLADFDTPAPNQLADLESFE